MGSRRMTSGKIPAEAQPMINQMTNWQRSKWGKAGYPPDQSNLSKFLKLTKKKVSKHV